MRRFSLAAILLMALPTSMATAFETRATAAYVVDITTDTVLLSKDAQTPLPPASMSKLMTLYMLFEAIEQNTAVTLDSEFQVSTRAREMGGSSMFLNERDRPTADELIKGIIVQSGNDATVVVAEGLGGSEASFAQLMTERAKSLGMMNSSFANASGWPHPLHRMSMEDLAILSQRIIEDYPTYYGYFSMPEWNYDGRVPTNGTNRNPLLKLGIGADGLKTGHTSEAGYGLVGSAQQDGRRIVFVLSGLTSERERAEEAERVVSWAFRQFVQKPVAGAGVEIAKIPVWMGDSGEVGVSATEPIEVLVPLVASKALEMKVEFEGPVSAPITAGDQIADLVITGPEMEPRRVPLVADGNVGVGGPLVRIRAAAETLYREFSAKDEGAAVN